MSKYLYGAAVQGIQSFIFQTNKLQEIVGASELVESICDDFFKEEIGKANFKEENLVLGAAGNIKYIFDNKEECEAFVRKFPKAVMEKAPGITISQAVVKYEVNGLNDALQDLEDKLKEQRNKVSIPYELGFMGTERARRTGGVAYKRRTKRNKGIEFIDEATHLKRLLGDPYYSEKYANDEKETLFRKISGLKSGEYDIKKDLLFETDDLKSSWLAVIHADGNGLGAIIQNLNKSLKDKNDEEVRQAFRSFSIAIEKSTTKAAQNAFNAVVENQKKDNAPYPIRPIVLGGDDLTVIIRADLALNFTSEFLKEFENQSEVNFKFLKDYGIDGFEKGLTACAGIAYVKKSYPFHYAVDLADKLCSDAKNFVKGKTEEYKGNSFVTDSLVPKSALNFFKVQDSFIESSLSEMKNRVAHANGYNFNYGPYLIEENDSYAHVSELIDKLKIVEDFEKTEKIDKGESKGISKLRQWVTEIYKDQATADFFLDRMKVINADFYKKIKPEDLKNGKSIIYDLIQLNTLKS